MTGYTLALASVIPLTGWAADRFGTKRLYLLAVALFTAGSVLCASASSLEMLVLFRVLQGLGGGMLMPLGMTILTRAAGPDRSAASWPCWASRCCWARSSAPSSAAG